MKVLEIKNVHKVYNSSEVKVHAVNDISLDFEKGEFAAIVGPSGSGKTTLLNMIGGLDTPTEGEIIVDNTNLAGLKSSALIDFRMKQIGFVFQSYNLIPVLTAKENIEYVMKLQGRSQQECDERIQEVTQKLGIDTLLGKLPNQLSGGQQQRVAVARAVAATPKLILADEPTANLDSKTAESLMDMMQRLNEEEGVTIIFSSHDPLVIGKAKHSIVLKDGKVIANERLS